MFLYFVISAQCISFTACQISSMVLGLNLRYWDTNSVLKTLELVLSLKVHLGFNGTTQEIAWNCDFTVFKSHADKFTLRLQGFTLIAVYLLSSSIILPDSAKDFVNRGTTSTSIYLKKNFSSILTLPFVALLNRYYHRCLSWCQGGLCKFNQVSDLLHCPELSSQQMLAVFKQHNNCDVSSYIFVLLFWNDCCFIGRVSKNKYLYSDRTVKFIQCPY